MKKLLLCVASLMLAFCANAQVTTPVKLMETGAVYNAMSPNGRYMAGENYFLGMGAVEVYDLESGERYFYFDEEEEAQYTIGVGGNSISNDGTVVLSTTENSTAAYAKDGVLMFLPVPESASSALSNAITPDGSRIAGSMGIGLTLENVLMQTPVIWNRLEDGTYSDPIVLPHPTVDLTGRTPQYILVDGISADGKTVACQMIDYFGSLATPLIIRENESGEWSYTMLASELINPMGIDFDEVPGEEPVAVDFMSEEEKAAYAEAQEKAESLMEPNVADFMTEEAYTAYLDKLMTEGWASAYDFMTEEQAAAYEAAQNQYWKDKYPSAKDFLSEEELAAFEAATEAWEAAYEEFSTNYVMVLYTSTLFNMNELVMSNNGRYYAAAGIPAESEEASVYVFDLETDEVKVKGIEGCNITPTKATSNGGFVAGDQLSNGYISPSFDEDVEPLQNYVEKHNPTLYAWMQENMYITVVSYDWDWENDEEIITETQRWETGIPTCTDDMSFLATYVLDWSQEIPFFSYLLPMNTEDAIQQIDGGQPAVQMAANGEIMLGDGVKDVQVYDMSGRLVCSAKNNGRGIQTNLGRGSYILKAGNSVMKVVR